MASAGGYTGNFTGRRCFGRFLFADTAGGNRGKTKKYGKMRRSAGEEYENKMKNQ